MARPSPAWSYLPVDDLRLPVAGFTCLGSHERNPMSYELLSLSGFGVDEFAAANAKIAAAQAAQRAALTSTPTLKLGSSPAIKGIADLFSLAPKTPAPKTTLVAPLPKITNPSPTIVPSVPVVDEDNAIHGGCSGGYVLSPEGTCVDPYAYSLQQAQDQKMQTYLIATGLVVALGTTAFFLTRKGK